MDRTAGNTRITVLSGDLTKEKTDAIVNAANPSLMGGGGVDGAIHRSGGASIIEECRTIITSIGRLETGKAVITGGGHLPARYVIHTVGPVWRGGVSGEAGLLAAAFKNSLSLADEKSLKSIAFPGISTGVYGYPLQEAAMVSLMAIKEYLEDGSSLEEVRIVLFDENALTVWQDALEKA